MNYNKVIIAGNLTRDPELRQTQNGTSVTNITVAVNETIINDNEKSERTSFIACVGFGRIAENIQKYFTKGKPIFIEGRLSQDSYEDINGAKQTKTKVIIQKFEFIDKQESSNKAVETFEKRPQEQKGINTQDEDEIPF